MATDQVLVLPALMPHVAFASKKVEVDMGWSQGQVCAASGGVCFHYAFVTQV